MQLCYMISSATTQSNVESVIAVTDVAFAATSATRAAFTNIPVADSE